MGGQGSGRKPGFAMRFTTLDVFNLDVRFMSRRKMLSPRSSRKLHWSDDLMGQSFEAEMEVRTASIRLTHAAPPGQVGQISYDIPLTTTHTSFGGQRVWFLCPEQMCRRRVVILYKRGLFRCRQCQNLTYATCRGGELASVTSALLSLRARLGWPGDPLDGIENQRKKGMHRRTYERLFEEYCALDDRLHTLSSFRV